MTFQKLHIALIAVACAGILICAAAFSHAKTDFEDSKGGLATAKSRLSAINPKSLIEVPSVKPEPIVFPSVVPPKISLVPSSSSLDIASSSNGKKPSNGKKK